jgi:hypothetical protein
LSIQSPTKRKLSSLDISGPSSGSKRSKQSKGDKQTELMAGAFGKLTNMLGKFSPPSPPPASAPMPPTLPGTTAVGEFLERLKESEQRGDVWLLDDEVTRMLELFEKSESTSTYYLAVAKKSSEGVLRQWVRRRLDAHAHPETPDM